MQLMSELKVSLLWVSVLTRSGAMARVSFRASGAEGRLLRGYAPPEADGPLNCPDLAVHSPGRLVRFRE